MSEKVASKIDWSMVTSEFIDVTVFGPGSKTYPLAPQFRYGEVVSVEGVFHDYRYMVLAQRGGRMDLMILNGGPQSEGWVMQDIVIGDGSNWRRHR